MTAWYNIQGIGSTNIGLHHMGVSNEGVKPDKSVVKWMTACEEHYFKSFFDILTLHTFHSLHQNRLQTSMRPAHAVSYSSSDLSIFLHVTYHKTHLEEI